MKNQKLMVNQKFFRQRVARAIIPRKCGETVGAWNLDLNLVAMLVFF